MASKRCRTNVSRNASRNVTTESAYRRMFVNALQDTEAIIVIKVSGFGLTRLVVGGDGGK